MSPLPPPQPQGAPGGRRVFVSYARSDRERVQPIVEAIAAEGCEVWWDSHIEGGAAFAREIEAALEGAEAVVVIWSGASVGSDWVRDEAAAGRDKGRLAPVRIDPVAAPLGFGQYQVVDLVGWTGDRAAASFRRLMGAIERAAAGPRAGPAPRPARAAVHRPSRRMVWIAGAAAAPAAAAVAAGGWWMLRRPAPARSVAVLPFANLTGDAAQDLTADALAEDVRSALARLPALQVISRTSSELFRGARQDAAGIAARLGVAYLLEGTVQSGAGVLRIGAHLVQGANGFERWSQVFDRPASDLLALESDIAGQVAAALQVKLMGDSALAPGGTRSPPASQAYHQARSLYDAGGDEPSLRQAVGLYEQAVALDPNYADAQAGRARTLMAIANQFATGATRRSLSDQGLAAAEAAARLAPDSADAQAALAFARMGRLDIKGARGPYERAGALGAGDADRLVGFGAYEARIGRFELALPALRRAVLLDPLNPNAHLTLGDGLYLARRADEAAGPLQRALQLNPGMTFVHSRLGDCRLVAGDIAGALAEYRAEPAVLYRLTGLAIALQRQGQAVQARAALAELLAKTGDNGLYQQAQTLAQWGRPGPCLDALERGLQLKDAGLTRLKVDPMLEPVRAEPRFTRLLALLGLA